MCAYVPILYLYAYLYVPILTLNLCQYITLKMCAYSISNLKYVPIVYRNLCPTKSLNNETFPVMILFTKCSLSNPFSIIVNNASSMFAEMYHRFPSEAIVFRITTRLDSLLRIISSKSRKVTVENQFIFSEKSRDS